MKHQLLLSFTGLIFRCLLIFSVVAALAGCASTAERTETMLKEGRVDEALRLIEEERAKFPKDDEAKGLERKVRLQWISDKLIEVRLARLAGNAGPSGELMRKVLSNEAAWAMMPVGAVYSTQSEEVEYLATAVQTGIYAALKMKQPLAAKARFLTDRALLEDTLKIDTRRVKSDIAQAGREFCFNEAKKVTMKDYYTALFLQKSCAVFATKVVIPKTKNSVQLFGAISPDLKLTGVPPERVSDFARDFKIEFEKSIWYDADSKRPLTLALAGPLVEKIDVRPVWRSKPYSVRVPYEERSVRKKTEKSGLETIAGILAWAFLAEYRMDREIDNHDGTVTLIETKYRDETRNYPYQANEVTQTLSIDWKLRLSPSESEEKYEFDFKEKNELISEEHEVRFADAGLYPQQRKILRPSDWLVTLNRKLMGQIGQAFHRAWVAKFCQPLGPKDSGELQQRCLYGADGLTPSFNGDWFSQNYGLEIDRWRELTGPGPVL